MRQHSSKTIIGSTLTISFLSMVIIATLFALSQIKSDLRYNVLKSLQTVNQTTQEALQIWINYLTTDLIDITYEKQVIDLTQELLVKEKNHSGIIHSVSLVQLRAIVTKKLRKHTLNGFTLISPSRTNIASLHDENIGNLNNIHKQRKAYLDRAFAGETLFIPTVHADSPLKTQTGEYRNHLPTIFIASPILDPSGKAIAVLAMLIDPSKDFTRIMQLGRIGESGETYAFDDKGMLISESRFDYQLRRTGLINESDKGILSIRISDPGGNMLKGFTPTIPPNERSLTVMAESAIAKNTSHNTEGYRDYRGVNVLGAWSWNERFGFGITTELNADEAMRPYYKTRLLINVVLALTIILSLIMLYILLWLGKEHEIK